MTGAYTISHITNIVQGKLKGSAGDTLIHYLVTDSRRLIQANDSLFFALDGPRRSGESFIEELHSRGVRNFVVNNLFDTSRYSDSNFIQVKNVLLALQELTAFHRSEFNIPVIGITGSNGKTIVKEWLNQLLENRYIVVRSPKSYNSQIGVPLSVWQMNSTHTMGIFEAGISQPGEMERLASVIQPTIGVLTHIGDAHNENFSSLKQKIEEKLKLFAHTQWMVSNGDDQLVRKAIEHAGLPCLFWGSDEANEVKVIMIGKQEDATIIDIETGAVRLKGIGRGPA